jgi:hypothetical protein
MKILRFLTPAVIFVAVLCIGFVITLSGKVHPAWVIAVGGVAYLAAIAGERLAVAVFGSELNVMSVPSARCSIATSVDVDLESRTWTFHVPGDWTIHGNRYLIVPLATDEGSAKQ